MTKQSGKGKKRSNKGFRIIRQNVAGVDLGAEEHYVCCPKSTKADPNVRVFKTNTAALEQLCDWLMSQKIVSVAMESTGVYWIPLYEMLEKRGIEPLLVDTRHLSCVPGRKTDMLDCQWIQLLHSCGLLNGAFRPEEQTCQLRGLVRACATMIKERADWLRRMQKELDQMNVRVHRAVSDISGATGMAIINAIVNGQRNPKKLARLRDPRCRLSEEDIATELTGTWHKDHLFNLAQALEMFEFITKRIEAYEEEIQTQLRSMKQDSIDPDALEDPKNKNKSANIKKRGQGPMRKALYAMCGVDLTAIDGIGVETTQVILSEVGADVSAFPTESQFISYVTLAPKLNISAGKPTRKKSKSLSSSRLGQALRMAAMTLSNSKTAMGAYYRRIAIRKGASIAIFATARKLAQHVYRMLRYGKRYVDIGVKAYESRFRERKIRNLKENAKSLGYVLLTRDEARSLAT